MELLTVQEAANRVGVTAKAIYYHINRGEFTRHCQYGRVLVDEAEITRYKPRKESATSSDKLQGYGLLAGMKGGSYAFMKRKAAEKALER